MSTKRTVSRWLLWISVALLASPGLADAQNAVLYEVTETMKITGTETSRRQATAALMGTVNAGTSLCPALLAQALGIQRCNVVANASNTIDLSTGHGPVGGRFAVLVPGDNPVDAAEAVIARGTIMGRMDLSPVVLNGYPLGSLQGTWSARGERGGPLDGIRLHGTVVGVFRLPFVFGVPEGCVDDGDTSDCWWVSNPAYWVTGPVDLGAGEYSLGVPTVRLELTFTETSRRPDRGGRDEDDD